MLRRTERAKPRKEESKRSLVGAAESLRLTPFIVISRIEPHSLFNDEGDKVLGGRQSKVESPMLGRKTAWLTLKLVGQSGRLQQGHNFV
jgi:hypothetical protein